MLTALRVANRRIVNLVRGASGVQQVAKVCAIVTEFKARETMSVVYLATEL
jgi:hypothetical protein